jgi:uncharacterized protein YciI
MYPSRLSRAAVLYLGISTVVGVRGFSAAAPVGGVRKLCVLQYHYIEDILAKRAPHREEHLRILKAFSEQGRCLLAGAYDPPSGASLFFADRSAAEEFLASDPYKKNGLVTRSSIVDYNAVTGTFLDGASSST